MEPLLELSDVSFTYHTKESETRAIANLGFSVYEGEFVSVIGPSGCGKTTVLSMIAGLIPPTGGKVLFRGEAVTRPSDKLGYMLQKDQLFPWRTIEQNVFLPLEIKKLNDAEHREYAVRLLMKYGLGDFRKSYPDRLSGGMRQRAALIRTLAPSPELLLLDEPFSALDYQTRLAVCDDVYAIIKSEKKTAILVTHDISEAISLSDRIVVLTARPARVKNIHVLDLGGAGTPLKRREHPDFSRLFERLWKELNQ